MPHSPPETVVRIAAVVLILFQVEVFAGILLGDGYALPMVLAAASTIGVIAAEIAARLLGGNEPHSPALPPLPPGYGF